MGCLLGELTTSQQDGYKSPNTK